MSVVEQKLVKLPGNAVRVLADVPVDESRPCNNKRAYAGADWVKANYKGGLSPLGVAVADILGDVFFGIYHLSNSSLDKVEWGNDHHIVITIDRELSTVDSDGLTRLVVLAHDRMVRVGIRGRGPGYMQLIFHQREKREGRMSERCPTMEEHMAEIRLHYELAES